MGDALMNGKKIWTEKSIEELEKIQPFHGETYENYGIIYFRNWRKTNGEVTEKMKRYINEGKLSDDMTLAELEGIRPFVTNKWFGMLVLTPRIKALGGITSDGLYDLSTLNKIKQNKNPEYLELEKQCRNALAENKHKAYKELKAKQAALAAE